MARFLGLISALYYFSERAQDGRMPRANRYILPGRIYHLTHRCHDRRFLFRFAKDRNGYRARLREAVLAAKVSLLTYNITSNRVHPLVYAEASESVGELGPSKGIWASFGGRKQRHESLRALHFAVTK